jgi:hypothetical protein
MLRSTLGALIQDHSKPPTPRHCKFCQLVHSLFSISVRQIGGPQMKISFSRSSLLTAIAIVILLSALPGAIRRVMQSGDPYLFTQRFFEDLWARLLGPGRLRFILQPTAAILLGVRDGKRDSRVGLPPFLSGLVFQRTHRLELWRSSIASVRDLVAIAIILDVISQILIFREIHPGAALLLGPVLITTPYSASRALANRIARRRTQQVAANRPT